MSTGSLSHTHTQPIPSSVMCQMNSQLTDTVTHDASLSHDHYKGNYRLTFPFHHLSKVTYEWEKGREAMKWTNEHLCTRKQVFVPNQINVSLYHNPTERSETFPTFGTTPGRTLLIREHSRTWPSYRRETRTHKTDEDWNCSKQTPVCVTWWGRYYEVWTINLKTIEIEYICFIHVFVLFSSTQHLSK